MVSLLHVLQFFTRIQCGEICFVNPFLFFFSADKNVPYLSCRASSSAFIIPLQKFLKSLDHPFSVGMRFKMRFETEDAAERRFGSHECHVL